MRSAISVSRRRSPGLSLPLLMSSRTAAYTNWPRSDDGSERVDALRAFEARAREVFGAVVVLALRAVATSIVV
jgi:hypothetical protein